MSARVAWSPARRRVGQGLSRARTSRPRNRLRVIGDGASELVHRTRPVLARRVSLTLTNVPPPPYSVTSSVPASTAAAHSSPQSSTTSVSSANASPVSLTSQSNADPSYPRSYCRGTSDPSYDLPTHHTQLFTNLGPWPTSIGVPSVAVAGHCTSGLYVSGWKRARGDEAEVEAEEQISVRKRRWWEKEE